MKKIWNRFLVNYFNGIVLLLPIVLTVLLVRFLVIKVNNMILSPIVELLMPMSGGRHILIAKAIVFVIVIVFMAAIGWGAKILVVNRMFSFGEGIILRVPVLGKIYNAAKQIFSTVFGQGKTIFKQVVLIEYPRKGLYSIGFATGDTKGEVKDSIGQHGVNIFIPTTPNPTSGLFLIVPKDNVQFLEMSVEDGMKLVISGGSVSPEYRAE